MDVESVVLTGPVLFILGLLTLWNGIRAGHRLTLLVGAAHCGICSLFVALVNLLNWSPPEAREPFLLLGGAYSLAILAPTVMVLGANQQRPTPY